MAGREILVLWAGRRVRRPWEELCADFRGRVERHVPVIDRPLKVRGDGPDRRRAEGEALRAALPEPAWPIALDPRGKTMSTEALAEELGRLHGEWPHPIAFLIGSDLGLDESVLAAARLRLSLGPMVLGHELARLVLYEQLYRWVSISRGIKYHRAPL